MTEGDGIQKVLDRITDKPVDREIVMATPLRLLMDAGKTEDEARALLGIGN